MSTSFGRTSVVAALALVSAICALAAKNGGGRLLSLTALAGTGLALALSGHASAAEPQWLTRSMVFLHDRYHQTHRAELAWLIPLAQKVERVHGDHPSAPTGLSQVLERLRHELESHMMKEEQVLFPMMQRGGSPMIAHPIAQMRHEHDDEVEHLRAIEHVTHGLSLPPGACGSWTALYTGLRKFTDDLVTHMHLENAVLFPRFETQSQAAVDTNRPEALEIALAGAIPPAVFSGGGMGACRARGLASSGRDRAGKGRMAQQRATVRHGRRCRRGLSPDGSSSLDEEGACLAGPHRHRYLSLVRRPYHRSSLGSFAARRRRDRGIRPLRIPDRDIGARRGVFPSLAPFLDAALLGCAWLERISLPRHPESEGHDPSVVHGADRSDSRTRGARLHSALAGPDGTGEVILRPPGVFLSGDRGPSGRHLARRCPPGHVVRSPADFRGRSAAVADERMAKRQDPPISGPVYPARRVRLDPGGARSVFSSPATTFVGTSAEVS